MRNPLNVDVTLSGLSVTVSEASAENAETFKDEVEIEIIDDITLGARETRTVRSLSHRNSVFTIHTACRSQSL